MANKNTRIVYTDETNLNIYRSLPEKDFKEFMMAYLTYKKGDNLDDMFTSLTAKLLFMAYVSKIEYNEDKWEKQAKANKENGKKGGRPKKTDITPNTEFDYGRKEATAVQEEQSTEQEQVSRENQQDTFQESEEQNEFEVEDFIADNIEPILIAKYQSNGDMYTALFVKLQDDVIEKFPYVGRDEVYMLITNEIKRRCNKVS